ncbi:MAG: SCO family protein [Chloroflexota bacterium]
MTRARFRLVVLAFGGLSLGLLLGWGALRLPADGASTLHGTVLQPTEPAADFELLAHDGRRVHLQDYRGRVVLLYFGYTYCPDVCPATLAALARTRRELSPAEREQTQVFLVTVDPERDSPEVLAGYLAHFDPAFIGLTGTAGEILAAATPFGIYYQKSAESPAGRYLIDHTASVMVVDKAGYLRVVYPFNTASEEIAADLRYLLRE